ncbi:hypothetical protein [Mucilaginibacter sp. 44-25]|jgi:hypothetical protein|uniref:hypothetical protein n=1 Tax=Mucilaginibacter sp. 44-25 TaxID=1895794 RepID=UPI0025E788B8|nr:hypothetical protein [Mucilaginibacter sp. 44-25]
MKSIAVFLVLNILLLSSISGMANVCHGKASCCVEKLQKDCCNHAKHNSSADCAKGNCKAMLSCGTCDFVFSDTVSTSPTISILKNQSASPFAIGELSDYHGNGWNPPKLIN